MTPRVPAALALAVVLPLLGACASDNGEAAPDASNQPPPSATVTFEARDNSFTPEQAAVPAGAIEIVVRQAGTNPHTFLFEGIGSAFLLEVTQSGAVARGVIELSAGTYTFFCDVPGHRADGMEGTLTVR